MSKILPYAAQAFDYGHLRVSDLHEIYYEQGGNPRGIPAMILHGGPGAGSDENALRFFDLEKYRVIMFDQRGCGNSRPWAETEDNTITALCDDIKNLKKYLKIQHPLWLFGASWGTALAQKYALKYPDSVAGLILFGTCFGDQPGAKLLVDVGEASKNHPQAFKIYADPDFAPECFDEKGNVIAETLPKAYYERLTGADEKIAAEAAGRFMRWDLRLMERLDPRDESDVQNNQHIKKLLEKYERHPEKALPLSRLFFHFYTNEYDPAGPEDHLNAMKKHYPDNKPLYVFHGEDDMITPLRFSEMLTETVAHAKLAIIPDEGHMKYNTAIISMIRTLTDSLADGSAPKIKMQDPAL